MSEILTSKIMRKGSNHFWFIIGLTTLLIILLLCNFTTKKEISQTSATFEKKLLSFPKFSALDLNGKKITKVNFKEKNIFVQFINPKSFDQIELLRNVYSDFKNNNLSFLIFIQNPQKLGNKNIKEFNLEKDVIIISSNYEKFKRIFHVPVCCEKFYIFDDSGKLFIENFNSIGYEAVRMYLNSFLYNKDFSISSFLGLGKIIENMDWFKPLWNRIQNKNIYNYYIITMFTDICEECLSGMLLNRLKKYGVHKKSSFYFASILSDDFTENDIKNLKEQLEIKFDVFKADKKLSKKWRQMIEVYGESNLTNIVFFLNENGKIVQMAYPECKCYQDAFLYLDKIINN